MRRIRSLFLALMALWLAVTGGCLGFRAASSGRGGSDAGIPPMLSKWVGEYGGNVRVQSFEKSVKDTYPAHLSIKRQGRQVVMKLNIPNFNVAYFDVISKKPIELKKDIVWTIKSSPAKFAASTVTLSYDTTDGKRKLAQEFTATLSGVRLTGEFTRGHTDNRGNPTLFERFMLDFSKIE